MKRIDFGVSGVSGGFGVAGGSGHFKSFSKVISLHSYKINK